MFMLNFFSNLYSNIFLKILIKFLRELVVDNGFTLISHDNKKYKISEVTEKSLNIKILDKSLYGKIVLFPGLYFGEAYMKNKIKIHNGDISDFLEIILRNVNKYI